MKSLFYAGQSFDAYRYLGAHCEKDGVYFCTYAPNAGAVSLLWEEKELPMQAVYDGNFYALHVAQAKAGACYEYRIYHKDRGYTDHCDPYGFAMQLRPAHKSVVCDLTSYSFSDDAWMNSRHNGTDQPLNIYELHLGSFRRKENGAFYTYTETAAALIPYLKETGYTHVELMPISEHPCDESWGYQNTGFFAPTSRYGTPQQLMELVDLLHQNGIGVILDFVPVHFAVDDYALAKYDGTALYEYPHPSVGISEWGSYNFLHARGEVRSFLQSNADYWLRLYHFDGLRMDAVSRMLYWQGDEKRGENGNAVDFIKVMNQGLKQRHRGIMLIAEDSTDYPGVTKPVSDGGLGFDYKWDMGWMHDTLEYFQLSPKKRQTAYHKLSFSMLYYHRERYLLALSHDEVVHGKATILQKMYGAYWDKFPQARAMYLYMTVHPGKKLHFMGNEIGQLREWDESREQDWMLRQYPIHDSFYRFICDLNAVYRDHPALWEWDHRQEGFDWVECHAECQCIYAISRKNAKQQCIAVFNFSDKPQVYPLPEEYAALCYDPLLNTAWEQYGGSQPNGKSALVNGNVMLERFSGVLFAVKT